MIINCEYDKSLWLVTYIDKKNRDMISNFINSIPDSVYDKIRISADIISSYKNENVPYADRKYKELHDSVIAEDKIMYWYRFDPYSFVLTLGYSIFNGKNYDEALELTLYPYEQEEIELYKRCLMARRNMISVDKQTVVEEVKYAIEKSKFGYRMWLLSNERNVFKGINIDKMPEEIEFSDLRKSNILVRKKVPSKNK